MRVLGLDTATRATVAALLDTESDLAHERRDDPPEGARPRHTTRLLALLAEVLAQAGTDWSGVDRIAVGLGPGTFTGIRIGIASARALAAARGVPIAGVGTLSALAAPAGRAAPDELVAAVLDARRGEVFAAVRESTPGPGEPVLAPQALAPQALARALRELGGEVLAVGDGALAHREVLEAAGARIPPEDSPLHRVSATEICRLAAAGPAGAPDAIRPLYLREPDAELGRRRAETR